MPGTVRDSYSTMHATQSISTSETLMFLKLIEIGWCNMELWSYRNHSAMHHPIYINFRNIDVSEVDRDWVMHGTELL